MILGVHSLMCDCRLMVLHNKKPLQVMHTDCSSFLMIVTEVQDTALHEAIHMSAKLQSRVCEVHACIPYIPWQ
jgi:hypothetical protein